MMKIAEWEQSEDPVAMLRHIEPRASHRQLRLLAIACAKFQLGNRRAPVYRTALQLAEQYADDTITQEQFLTQLPALDPSALPPRRKTSKDTIRRYAVDCAVTPNYTDEPLAERIHKGQHLPCGPLMMGWMVREIFPNPNIVRPDAPDWLTPAVRRIAKAIDKDEEYFLLPNLLRELRAAGCEDVLILNHVSATLRHYHGCWALEWLAGRERVGTTGT